MLEKLNGKDDSADQLTLTGRVAKLEREVSLLKDAVKLLCQEIADLKKAQ